MKTCIKKEKMMESFCARMRSFFSCVKIDLLHKTPMEKLSSRHTSHVTDNQFLLLAETMKKKTGSGRKGEPQGGVLSPVCKGSVGSQLFILNVTVLRTDMY